MRPLVLLAVAWEGLTRAGIVPISALPPLDTVARAWYDLASSGDLWTNGIASMTRGAAGLGSSSLARRTEGESFAAYITRADEEWLL